MSTYEALVDLHECLSREFRELCVLAERFDKRTAKTFELVDLGGATLSGAQVQQLATAIRNLIAGRDLITPALRDADEALRQLAKQGKVAEVAAGMGKSGIAAAATRLAEEAKGIAEHELEGAYALIAAMRCDLEAGAIPVLVAP